MSPLSWKTLPWACLYATEISHLVESVRPVILELKIFQTEALFLHQDQKFLVVRIYLVFQRSHVFHQTPNLRIQHSFFLLCVFVEFLVTSFSHFALSLNKLVYHDKFVASVLEELLEVHLLDSGCKFIQASFEISLNLAVFKLGHFLALSADAKNRVSVWHIVFPLSSIVVVLSLLETYTMSHAILPIAEVASSLGHRLVPKPIFLSFVPAADVDIVAAF